MLKVAESSARLILDNVRLVQHIAEHVAYLGVEVL